MCSHSIDIERDPSYHLAIALPDSELSSFAVGVVPWHLLPVNLRIIGCADFEVAATIARSWCIMDAR